MLSVLALKVGFHMRVYSIHIRSSSVRTSKRLKRSNKLQWLKKLSFAQSPVQDSIRDAACVCVLVSVCVRVCPCVSEPTLPGATHPVAYSSNEARPLRL